MSRILCVWELGADFGHMSRFLPLALKLRERGHEVVFALKDLSNAEAILGRHGFALLQAPLWLPAIPGLPKMPVSYTELICQFGFLNQPGLTGLVKGWRELYALVKPDLILADHSPTALLASRGLPFRRCLIGTGFCSPPRVNPFPNMRTWLKIPPERLPDVEKNVLQTANAVLAGFGVKPMIALFEMFDVDEDFLCTFPELDHYADRGPARYWSPVFAKDHGQELKWPEPRQGKRVFAYLKPRYRDYEKILGLLRQVKGTVLVFSPGISKAMARKYQSPRVIITTQPVKLAGILPGCDLAICHAGHGTVAASLLAGGASARAADTNALTAEQMFEGGAKTYNNWVEFSVGGMMTRGQGAQAEERHRLNRGIAPIGMIRPETRLRVDLKLPQHINGPPRRALVARLFSGGIARALNQQRLREPVGPVFQRERGKVGQEHVLPHHAAQDATLPPRKQLRPQHRRVRMAVVPRLKQRHLRIHLDRLDMHAPQKIAAVHGVAMR